MSRHFAEDFSVYHDQEIQVDNISQLPPSHLTANISCHRYNQSSCRPETQSRISRASPLTATFMRRIYLIGAALWILLTSQETGCVYPMMHLILVSRIWISGWAWGVWTSSTWDLNEYWVEKRCKGLRVK